MSDTAIALKGGADARLMPAESAGQMRVRSGRGVRFLKVLVSELSRIRQYQDDAEQLRARLRQGRRRA